MKRGVRVNGGDCCYQNDRSTEVSVASSSSSSSALRVPAGSFALTAVGDACAGGGMNYIQHPVSKMDTLAGVAIRYGVEVTDIKRINGLVSDFQMFGLKTLQIPLPGRHPPTPTLADGFDSHGYGYGYGYGLKLCPAICSIQSYYSIKLGGDEEGLERSAHGEGESDLFSKSSNPPLDPHRKCRSVVFMNLEEGEDALTRESSSSSKYYTFNGDSSSSGEKFMRRRQKSESDFLRNPEMSLLKEDDCSSGGFSAIGIGSKGLALRPKAAASRAIAVTVAESEAESSNSACASANSLSIVRRSSSTSNLQDSDTSTFTSLWPITRPILFDSLPKPITGRRNKAALD